MARTQHRLKEYQAKRDFARTPEPAGGKSPQSHTRKRFFCVQKHLASHLHYDFRLEHDGALLSWAVPKGPSLNPRDKRLAMQVEDHPLEYGQFEGVIPQGYGAGIVMLWDKGTWEPLEECNDVDASIKKGQIKFQLHGQKLKGSWVLIRLKRPPGGQGGSRPSWLLIKHGDAWASSSDVTEALPRSVKTGRDFAEILADEAPDARRVQHAGKQDVTTEAMELIAKDAARSKASGRAGRDRPAKRRKC